MIRKKRIRNWLHLINTGARTKEQRFKEEESKKEESRAGKYLIFSDDFDKLLSLGKRLLKENNRHHAKVCLWRAPYKEGYSLVLCLYDHRKYKTLEKKLIKMSEVNYFGWKLEKERDYPEFRKLVKREEKEVYVKEKLVDKNKVEIILDDTCLEGITLPYKEADKINIGEKLEATIRPSWGDDFFFDMFEPGSRHTISHTLEKLENKKGEIVYERKDI